MARHSMHSFGGATDAPRWDNPPSLSHSSTQAAQPGCRQASNFLPLAHLCQDGVQVRGVPHDARILLLDGAQVLHHRVCQPRLEVAPSHGPHLRRHSLLALPAHALVDGEQVARLGAVRVVQLQTLVRVRLGALRAAGSGGRGGGRWRCVRRMRRGS